MDIEHHHVIKGQNSSLKNQIIDYAKIFLDFKLQGNYKKFLMEHFKCSASTVNKALK